MGLEPMTSASRTQHSKPTELHPVYKISPPRNPKLTNYIVIKDWIQTNRYIIKPISYYLGGVFASFCRRLVLFRRAAFELSFSEKKCFFGLFLVEGLQSLVVLSFFSLLLFFVGLLEVLL